MGQSNSKSVIATTLLATAIAGIAGTYALGLLPHWVSVVITALLAAGITASLVQWRLLGPLNALHAELRSNLLGSSILFDAAPPDDDDPGDSTRDPMLFAIDRLKHMAEQMAEHGNQIAISSAEVAFAARQMHSDVLEEKQETGNLATTVKRIEGAMNALAQSAAQAAVCAERADQAGASGRRALASATQHIRSSDGQIRSTANRLDALAGRSEEMARMFADVHNIAEQTELLAVNAVSEAARVGEQGRGFAMAANDLRDLAQSTVATTRKISGAFTEIRTEAHTAAANISELGRHVAEGAALGSEADGHLADVRHHAETASERMQAVSEGASANWNELEQICSSALTFGCHLQAAASQAGQVSGQVARLAATAEAIHGQVVTLGGQSQHAHMRFVAQSVAQSIGQTFEQALEEERITESTLFDHERTDRAAGQVTPFDDFAGQVLPTVVESVVELNPELTYLGIANSGGHLPIHKQHTTEPGCDDGGPVSSELIEKRCGSSTEPFLLQTFKNRSGTVVHDMSSPIYVNGHHWGGFRMGYRAQVD